MLEKIVFGEGFPTEDVDDDIHPAGEHVADGGKAKGKCKMESNIPSIDVEAVYEELRRRFEEMRNADHLKRLAKDAMRKITEDCAAIRRKPFCRSDSRRGRGRTISPEQRSRSR